MQSKRIQHNTAKGAGTSDVPAPSSIGTESTGGRDLQHTSSLKVRDFTWDSSFKFVFVVVYSHAALKIIMKDRAPLSMGPATAEGSINIADLSQGTTRHSIPLHTKSRTVCLEIHKGASEHVSGGGFGLWLGCKADACAGGDRRD